VPQIFVNGTPLGGFTDIAALDDEGKLDALLAAAPPAGAPALPQ
jgi:glutaredoxin 3